MEMGLGEIDKEKASRIQTVAEVQGKLVDVAAELKALCEMLKTAQYDGNGTDFTPEKAILIAEAIAERNGKSAQELSEQLDELVGLPL